jgi:hypothetical protein
MNSSMSRGPGDGPGFEREFQQTHIMSGILLSPGAIAASTGRKQSEAILAVIAIAKGLRTQAKVLVAYSENKLAVLGVRKSEIAFFLIRYYPRN